MCFLAKTSFSILGLLGMAFGFTLGFISSLISCFTLGLQTIFGELLAKLLLATDFCSFTFISTLGSSESLIPFLSNSILSQYSYSLCVLGLLLIRFCVK